MDACIFATITLVDTTVLAELATSWPKTRRTVLVRERLACICLKPHFVRDVFERALEALRVSKHTREMIMVAAASFIFVRTRLRVGLASTPILSQVEIFCS